MENKNLKIRNHIKKRKPQYLMHACHRKIRLWRQQRWKRPKGIHNKVREYKKGRVTRIEVGYGSPADVRGMTRNGLMPVTVCNAKELRKVEAGCGAIIPRSVGQKKRAEIAGKAAELGITIINLKNPQEYAASVKEKLRQRKEKKQKSIKDREKKITEKEKKAAEKEKKGDLAEKLTDEEKKEHEKKEKEKVLTMKKAN